MGTTSISHYTVESELPPLRPEVMRFAALQPGLGRKVELRVLAAQPVEGDTAHLRFRQEIQVLTRLDHESLIRVLDVGVASGRPYYVTDLRQASTLTELLAERGGALPIAEAFRLATEVTAGLAHLHEHSLLLRRLDCQSIFLDRETGHFYLGDYTLCRRFDEPSLTQMGVPLFDLLPLLPEGRVLADLDRRSDLFLLSATLYHAFTGSDPWPELLGAIRNQTPPGLLTASARNPAAPRALDAVLGQGLSFEPAERPATAAAMLAALTRAQETSRLHEAVNQALSGSQPRLPGAVPDKPWAERPSAVRAAAAPAPTPWWRSLLLPAGTLMVLALAWGLLGPRSASTTVRHPPTLRKAPAGRARLLLPVNPEELQFLAGQMARQPTDPSSFERRWEVAHRYFVRRASASKDAADALRKLVSLREGFASGPAGVCKTLDAVVAAEAGRLAAGR